MSEITDAESTAFYAKHGNEPVTHTVLATFADDVAALLRKLRGRIAELEAQQAKGMRYRGTWAGSAEAYSRGDVCTRSGTLWHCNATGTTDTPGSGSGWQLMHKTEGTK